MFFQRTLKARQLEITRLNYHDEKLRAIEISKGAKVHYTFAERLRLKRIRFKMKANDFIDKCTSFREHSWIYKKYILVTTNGTFENFILKSIVGFFSGILLTYMFFIFFVFQLHISLSSATLFCSILGVILTIGLAFSHRIRCIVFLLLPQFFSKRGRQALMAYAFILVLTGPAKNILHNIEVLSESLACGQEQVKSSLQTVIDLMKHPFNALRDAISKVMKMMKDVVKKIETALVSIKKIVLSILGVIKSAFDWLGSIVSICNKKLGTPFERCVKVFEGAVTDCQAKLGPFFSGICSIAYLAGHLCYVVQPLDFICIIVSFISDTIVHTVRKKIKKFTSHMKAMFYVKVNFDHSFHFETNKSANYGDVVTGMVTEIKSRSQGFLKILDWMSLITSFFILFMLLRVLNYRRKWLSSDRFDNKYLTKNFHHIDIIRARKDKETVLPLNRRERKKYIPLSSIFLIKNEKIKLTKSVIFLGLMTFKLCIHIAVDYSLHWILSTIRRHGRFQTKVDDVNSVGIHVSGDGFLAEIYKGIVGAFSPTETDAFMDTLPCLPDPAPPDRDRYIQIAIAITFCWIMAICEPFGLRLRQIVMGYYHPDREKQRAVWLYNHIIRSRGSFLKYARRQLRRKYGMTDGKNIEHVTCKERLFAVCPLLNKCFRQHQKLCLLCGAVERDTVEPHVKCPTPNCIGLFCIRCFADLENLCTICRAPMEYGDLSDLSEEKDSSDDPQSSKRSKPLENKISRGDVKSQKKRDDATMKVFRENLRGGADLVNENRKNSFAMRRLSNNSYASSIAETISFEVESSETSDEEMKSSNRFKSRKSGTIVNLLDRVPLFRKKSRDFYETEIQRPLLMTKVMKKK